jgi:nitrate reductase alpha subunit
MNKIIKYILNLFRKREHCRQLSLVSSSYSGPEQDSKFTIIKVVSKLTKIQEMYITSTIIKTFPVEVTTTKYYVSEKTKSGVTNVYNLEHLLKWSPHILTDQLNLYRDHEWELELNKNIFFENNTLTQIYLDDKETLRNNKLNELGV